jgi:Tfp pilus assembly protein PilV
MKQLKGNRGFELEEYVVAMLLICIVLIGMAALICVSMADFMRSRKRRADESTNSKPFLLRQRLGTEFHGQ